MASLRGAVVVAAILSAVSVLAVDSDNDGLEDDDELNIHNTDPQNPDTDGDGLGDGFEVQEGLDPTDSSDCPTWICPSTQSGWRSTVLRSAEPFNVLTIDPADGVTVESVPSAVTITFNDSIDSATVSTTTVTVTASGGDGNFDSGNETALVPAGLDVTGDTLTIDLSGSQNTDDTYQVSLDGTSVAPITDVDGTVLDGDLDDNPGGDFTSAFTVSAPPPTAPTFAEIQANIFDVSCALSGCHTGASPPQGLNLSAGQAYDNIVNVPSTEVSSLDRIEPNDPDNSYLVQKVEGTAAVGVRMPRNAAPLSQAAIQAIRDWVNDGAPNNGGGNAGGGGDGEPPY